MPSWIGTTTVGFSLGILPPTLTFGTSTWLQASSRLAIMLHLMRHGTSSQHDPLRRNCSTTLVLSRKKTCLLRPPSRQLMWRRTRPPPKLCPASPKLDTCARQISLPFRLTPTQSEHVWTTRQTRFHRGIVQYGLDICRQRAQQTEEGSMHMQWIHTCQPSPCLGPHLHQLCGSD